MPNKEGCGPLLAGAEFLGISWAGSWLARFACRRGWEDWLGRNGDQAQLINGTCCSDSQAKSCLIVLGRRKAQPGGLLIG